MIFVSHGASRNLVSSQNVVVTAAGSILEKSSHVSHLPLLDFKLCVYCIYPDTCIVIPIDTYK
jgi:hypothetical protein